MSWTATLDASQVRQFKAALQCLSKIGTELLIEAVPSKLILRSLNSSRSAFAAVTLHSNFFDAHAIFERRDIKGSVLVKHALAVFRTQRIQRLQLQLDVAQAEQLTATITSESGLQKQYRIPCMEAEILQATVDRDTLPTCVIAGANELNRLLQSFQSSLEEITIIATPEEMHNGVASKAVQIHSYLDPAKRHVDAAMYTQISVNTESVFHSYQHTSDEPADVTFNLKDFKVILALCLGMNADVAIRFQCPGQPLLVEPYLVHMHGSDIEAQLVLATLMESQSHRVTARQQPNTAPRTGRTRFQTPGAGRTPNIPGDTPAAATGGPGSNAVPGPSRFHQGQPPPTRPTRFAPDRPPQPSFDTPAPRPLERAAQPNTAQSPGLPGCIDNDASYDDDDDARAHPGTSGRGPADPDGMRGLRDDLDFGSGQLQAMEVEPSLRSGGPNHRLEDASLQAGASQASLKSQPKVGSAWEEGGGGRASTGRPPPESFEDDDWEEDANMPLRSRYHPRGLAADDDSDQDSEAVPGTP